MTRLTLHTKRRKRPDYRMGEMSAHQLLEIGLLSGMIPVVAELIVPRKNFGLIGERTTRLSTS